MTNTITSSEIAERLEALASDEMVQDARLTQAADTIRAQAEALKIATEALELVYASRVFLPPHVEAGVKSALARIKEVG